MVSVIDCAPGVVNNIEPEDMNLAKRRLSELTFLKNEIIGLYHDFSTTGGKLGAELTSQLEELDDSIDMLECQVQSWSRPNCYSAKDDPKQVPDLNGVPESHSWWTSQNRNAWKDKYSTK